MKKSFATAEHPQGVDENGEPRGIEMVEADDHRHPHQDETHSAMVEKSQAVKAEALCGPQGRIEVLEVALRRIRTLVDRSTLVWTTADEALNND